MAQEINLPDFDSLPKVEGMPQGCAWGIFDKDGEKDVFGTLNLLTPSVVKAAAAEVQDGVTISLNWGIDSFKSPIIGRKLLSHKVLCSKDKPNWKWISFDDEIEFNTQCSSQWDSLCHFAHQPTGLFYNGAQPSADDLSDPEKALQFPTLNRWHTRGGVVGRGVLIDYKAYADANNISYSPFESHAIPISTIQSIAESQGTTFHPGDILLVRSGLTEAMEGLDADQQTAAMTNPTNGGCVGVEGTVEAAKWFWNQHFAAVAGDMTAFEVVDGAKLFSGLDPAEALVLHQYFLGMFGMPIGELWDLKALSKACAERKKWTFLLTSVPLNYSGAVGSPPNALAIF
ncbi:hypothetical protein P152DRAFT_469121 [Eremomyces bilateralis CBS 781.70]|uniref:Cyclase n=1 Tax=Eremomyces bilateralis CBS 781.70 TaxID=1392243 RepID=A0A6G1FQT6_9PEZI|nr:uncharacterized protein P152DRAFT_469121 [Eremomyces bilateralis CBS 781.70]KAF1808195.1 hypothetical protein P152DRAFT_469121 [Eremomyces bilateralis CBS 781.70]